MVINIYYKKMMENLWKTASKPWVHKISLLLLDYSYA